MATASIMRRIEASVSARGEGTVIMKGNSHRRNGLAGTAPAYALQFKPMEWNGIGFRFVPEGLFQRTALERLLLSRLAGADGVRWKIAIRLTRISVRHYWRV
jgi:hypothetical protein